MPIQKTTRLADAVLSLIDVRLAEHKMLYAAPYKNGREDGWALYTLLQDGGKQVCFAENRNSDQLVVYAGTVGGFDCTGNVPSEFVWKERRYFAQTELYNAASFILGHLS